MIWNGKRIYHSCGRQMRLHFFNSFIRFTIESINQISIAPISPAKPGSTFWISVQQQNQRHSSVTSMGLRSCQCLWEQGQVKEMCLEIFLGGSNWNGWTDRQWGVVPERQSTGVKSSCTCVGPDPRDWQTNSLAWSQWTRRKWCGKHGMKINRLLFMKGLCRSTNWYWKIFEILRVTNERNEAVENCK